jgi:AraC-like DNA-binding protein
MPKRENPKKLAEDVTTWASNMMPRFGEFLRSVRMADDGVNLILNHAPLEFHYAEWVELDRRVRQFFKTTRIDPPPKKTGRPRVKVDMNKFRERMDELVQKARLRYSGQDSYYGLYVVTKLAKEFGVSRATVHRLIKRLDDESPAQQ